MSTTATTQLLPRPGVYYIVVAGGGFESQRLTDGGDHVTILPPSVGDGPRQEVMHYLHDEPVAHLPIFSLVAN